jgi:hypothetical protein
MLRRKSRAQNRTCVRERSPAQPALLSHSPERAHAKPRERQREANCNQHPSGRRVSCLVFLILTRQGEAAKYRHRQEHSAGHFQPQNMGQLPKRPCGRTRPLPHRVPDAAARGLFGKQLSRHARGCPQLPCGRNVVHGLDFNSLRRYNDATEPGRRTVPPPGASKECGRGPARGT